MLSTNAHAYPQFCTTFPQKREKKTSFAVSGLDSPFEYSVVALCTYGVGAWRPAVWARLLFLVRFSLASARIAARG